MEFDHKFNSNAYQKNEHAWQVVSMKFSAVRVIVWSQRRAAVSATTDNALTHRRYFAILNLIQRKERKEKTIKLFVSSRNA